LVTTDVRWLNPFISAAFSVLRSFDVEVTRSGQLSLEEDDCTADDTSVIVPVTGELEGAVFYGMDSGTAERMAGALVGDLRRVRWDDEILQSALGELGNMITGQASVLLEQAGKSCSIAPPLVVLAARVIVAPRPFERLLVPIETGLGRMHIRLSLRETTQA
jgi:chemotaxis protein CheX